MIEVAVRQRLGDFRLDVAFVAPDDDVTVLFGPSGAGKSATLAAIAGMPPTSERRIVLGDTVLDDSAAHIHVPPHRRRIGWVHQDARLFPHMSVRRNLGYGARRSPGGTGIDFDTLVESLAIEPLLDRGVATLSGGERQRVALGRALLSGPQLLLLDEPLAALDTARKEEILALIGRIKTSFALPIIYVTHSLAEAAALGDHFVRIERGTVTGEGPLSILSTSDTLCATVAERDVVGDTVTLDVSGRSATLPGAARCRGDMISILITEERKPL